MKIKMRKEKRFSWDLLLLALPILFWLIGLLLIKPTNILQLQEMGVTHQEECIGYDNENGEYEGVSLIEIDGIGSVFAYKDIYLSSVLFLVLSLILNQLIFKGKANETRCIIFANCLLGVLLIRVTSSANIIPTVLFWLGIVAASFYESGSPVMRESN
jgi:hypothetical protein